MAGPLRTESNLPPLDAAQQERMRELSHELRCLVCQNQTLADSSAELAGDLRNQVHELILDGRTDNQIKAYLVDRYGEFVLYRPPVQSNTALLWGGPFALLAVGAGVWWTIGRRQRAAEAMSSQEMPTHDGPRPASAGTIVDSGGDAPDADRRRAARDLLERH